MSLLMFRHEEDAVFIVTDTLATAPDGEAFMFQSKAWTLPHLNMAIAVTGIANLGAAWNDFLRSSAIVQDIGMVDGFTPEQLRRIWVGLQAENPDAEGMHATIYHFGFPVGSDRAVRYVYRSKENFESEFDEGPGFGVKPPPEGFELVSPESLDEFVELAKKIKTEQDAMPLTAKVAIGGELYLTLLNNWGSQTMRMHRFDDHESSWHEMIARINRVEGVA